ESSAPTSKPNVSTGIDANISTTTTTTTATTATTVTIAKTTNTPTQQQDNPNDGNKKSKGLTGFSVKGMTQGLSKIRGREKVDPFANFRFDPKIVDRFPLLDHPDTEIITTGSQLQYFCLPTGLFLTPFPSLPIFFTFVWTPASGDRIFGACLRFFEPVPTHI
ncbi:hypothetical protein RFI_19421, partial [Reticulomyxa filosa]